MHITLLFSQIRIFAVYKIKISFLKTCTLKPVFKGPQNAVVLYMSDQTPLLNIKTETFFLRIFQIGYRGQRCQNDFRSHRSVKTTINAVLFCQARSWRCHFI